MATQANPLSTANKATTFLKIIPICKVEELADGTLKVYGKVTGETPDSDKEVCDYAKTKPYYQARVNENIKKTSMSGMEISLMPLREMHQPIAAGKGLVIDFFDPEKVIKMGFDVVDPVSVLKVKKGVLPAFSQGGRYIEKWDDTEFEGCIRYVADPTEISLVDAGALPSAVIESIKARTVEMVKADGSTRLVKFGALMAEVKELPANDLAKLSAADVERISKAVAEQLAKQPTKDGEISMEDWQKKVIAKLVAQNITPAMLAAAVEKGTVAKSLWDVKDLTDVLSTITFVINCLRSEAAWEGDDSPVPDDLHQVLTQLCAVYVALATEESQELIAASSGKQEGEKAMDTKDLEKMTALEALQKGIADLLGKAKKSLVGYFTRAAVHNEAMIAQHEAMGKAHAAQAEKLGAEHESYELHKSAAAFHENAAKAYAKQRDEIYEAADEMNEGEKVARTEVKKIATPPVTQPAVGGSLEESIQLKLTTMLEKATDDGINRLLGSPDFQAKLEAAAMKKLGNALGSQEDPTPRKVHLIPRNGNPPDLSKMNGSSQNGVSIEDTGL